MTAATMEATTDLSTTPTARRRTNNLVWFELPVSDLTRATHFYERVFDTRLKTDERFHGLTIYPQRGGGRRGTHCRPVQRVFRALRLLPTARSSTSTATVTSMVCSNAPRSMARRFSKK